MAAILWFLTIWLFLDMVCFFSQNMSGNLVINTNSKYHTNMRFLLSNHAILSKLFGLNQQKSLV